MRKEYFILLLVALFWGSSHPVGKIILGQVTPMQLSLLRSGTAFLAVGIIAVVTGRVQALRRLDRRSFLLAVVTGLFGFAFTPLAGNTALRVIPASVNALLLNTSPLFIALGAPIVLRERFTMRTALGTVAALIGISVVTVADSGPLDVQSLAITGVLFSLLGALAWGLYTVGGRPFMKEFDAISITALMSCAGTLFLLVLVAFSDGFGQIMAASTSSKLLALYLGTITTGIGFTLWYYCLKALPAARVGVFQYLVPVFAVVLSNLLLHEPITLLLVVGMIFIIAGVRLVQMT